MPRISSKNHSYIYFVNIKVLVSMSLTFTLTGNKPNLKSYFYPAIELNPNKNYRLGLTRLVVFNSIPNIEQGINNKFVYYEKNKSDKKKEILIPEGSYEVNDIAKYLRERLEIDDLILQPNNNTLKCEIKSKTYDIDFRSQNTIGRLLGFSPQILKAGKDTHISDLQVDIVSVHTIRVECNIVQGAYFNNKSSHTLYEFSPNVDPGFMINLVPNHIIYLNINTKRIDNITCKIVDQLGRPVNFRGEHITIGLELQEV